MYLFIVLRYAFPSGTMGTREGAKGSQRDWRYMSGGIIKYNSITDELQKN